MVVCSPRIFGFVSLAAVLATCDALQPFENSENAMAAEGQPKAIEGYGSLKFGSTFMSAVTETGSERFNAYGVKECLDDLPLRGCFLSPASDATPYLIEAGIPYKLGLEFNKFDKLTDINLSYNREGQGNITFEECLSLHERTLDWLTKRYGRLLSTLNDKEKLEEKQTAAGNAYRLWRSPDGSFVTGFMRTAPANLPANIQRKPIPEWDNERYVNLLSHYISVDGNPMCSIGVEFSEPKSVERRPLLKNASVSPTEPQNLETAQSEESPRPVKEDDSLNDEDVPTDY